MREWLKKIREDKQMTQEDVAKKSSISRVYYLFIENGERGKPVKVDVAKKIAAALGFDWQRFYEEE